MHWIAIRDAVRRAANTVRTLLCAENRSATASLVDATRRRWAADSRVRIVACPKLRVDGDGTWVAAWVLGGDLAPIDADALGAAVRDLPLWPGEVYRLLRHEGLAYGEIAKRLGITADEVRDHVALALARLDAALGKD